MIHTDDTTAREVYESLWGQVREEYRLDWVEDATVADSPCMVLYAQAIEAAQLLSQQLGTEEDPRLERIINTLLDLQRELCLKMFDYGVEFARRTLR